MTTLVNSYNTQLKTMFFIPELAGKWSGWLNWTEKSNEAQGGQVSAISGLNLMSGRQVFAGRNQTLMKPHLVLSVHYC